MNQSVAEDAMARRDERHGDFAPFDRPQAVSASQHAAAAAALWPVSDTLRQGLKTQPSANVTQDLGGFHRTSDFCSASFSVSHTSTIRCKHKSRDLALESPSVSLYFIL